MTFNILAPGVIKHRYTVGGTYALDKDSGFTWGYVYAPKNSVTEPSTYNGMMPGASGITETVRMSQ